MLSGEIKMHTRPILVTIVIISMLLLATAPAKLAAQVVWENHTKEVYHYLSRMAQKGVIVFDDNIRPLSRKYIADCLDTLAQKPQLLNETEKKELAFYTKEYGNEIAASAGQDLIRDTRFLKRDAYKRWRSFAASDKGILLVADPVFTATAIGGSGKNVTRSSSGLGFWGYAGKHWAFHFFYNDVTESGKGFDTTRQNTPQTGFIRKDSGVYTSLNYTEFRGSISYSWNNGSLSFGQDHLLWGYGENGRVVLSDKVPTFPFIRLDYQPFPWLRFNYTHAWLNSRILDTAKSYPTGYPNVYDGRRDFYIPKFMATHSAQIKPVKGLDIAVGESIVYSDRLEAGYLFPLMFFKVYDNIANNSNIRAGSNGQLFLQVSSRNHLPKTHFYGSLFIDEIRIATILDRSKSRNQVGGTVGASITDVFTPYLTLGLEYTRVYPFVYQNLIPGQNYTSYNYFLGDWMGNNFDRLIYSVKYTPVPRLKCVLRYQTIRKGGMGSIESQYFQQPQPAFLFNYQNKQREIYTQFSYEWLNNLTLNAFYSSVSDQNQVNLQKRQTATYSIGFTYGL
jgi:hypothetical protein